MIIFLTPKFLTFRIQELNCRCIQNGLKIIDLSKHADMLVSTSKKLDRSLPKTNEECISSLQKCEFEAKNAIEYAREIEREFEEGSVEVNYVIHIGHTIKRVSLVTP